MGICRICHCHWSIHRFQTSYIEKLDEYILKFLYEFLKKEIKLKIAENQKKFKENYIKIYNFLLSRINYLYELDKQTLELNKIALLKDDEYSHKLLKENTDKNEKNDIYRFFEESL